jgi:hypothetical protein
LGGVAMPVRAKKGMDIVLREDNVGSTMGRVCYPGISSCITITGVHPNGLIGAHITAVTTQYEVQEILMAMKTGGASTCIKFYVVGAIRQFIQWTHEGFNDRKKMSDQIKKHTNKDATVWFYDTSDNSDVHIVAENVQGQTYFRYTPNTNHRVQGDIYPNLPDLITVQPHQFIVG